MKTARNVRKVGQKGETLGLQLTAEVLAAGIPQPETTQGPQLDHGFLRKGETADVTGDNG
jgi:hypothetical protein